MPGYISILYRPRVFYLLLAVFFIPIAVNLPLIPITWVDEIGYLDPALNFVQHGRYASPIWNVDGTEQVFAAHLPMLMWVHMITTFLFGTGPSVHRIYEILAGLVCIAFFYRSLKALYPGMNRIYLLLLPLLMLSDQAFYESLRSVRMEIIGYALLSMLLFYHLNRKGWWMRVLLTSLLFLVHPAFWAVALVCLVSLAIETGRDFRPGKTAAGIVLFSLPLLLYLWFCHFSISTILGQLLSHGADHSMAGKADAFTSHFWYRFCDHYRGTYTFDSYFQLFHPLLNLLCLAWAIYTLVKQKQNAGILPWLILLTHVFWFSTLGPLKRYTPLLILLNYLALPALYRAVTGMIKLKPAFTRGAAAVLMSAAFITGLAYFTMVNTLGLAQLTYRNPYTMQEWLDKHISGADGHVLVAGEPAGYFSARSHQADFFMPGLSDIKKYNKSYRKIYYLTYKDLENNKISEYFPEPGPLGHRLIHTSTTYYGLRLYELPDIVTLKYYVSAGGNSTGK